MSQTTTALPASTTPEIRKDQPLALTPINIEICRHNGTRIACRHCTASTAWHETQTTDLAQEGIRMKHHPRCRWGGRLTTSLAPLDGEEA